MVQVGTSKDQDLYNKPSAAVHPGALDAGTLPQYNLCVLEGKGTARSMAWVSGHLLAGIWCSNPAGGLNVSLV